MTVAIFDPAYKLTLAYEGGFSDHPKDPGGPTNKGVTQTVYDAYRRLAGQPKQSVRLIQDGEVRAIYLQQYWMAIRGNSLPDGVAFATYDFAVNSGVARAARFLQRIAGVDDDGIIGNVTLARVADMAATNEEGLVVRLCNERMTFLRGLRTYPTFGAGWKRRVMGAQDGAQPGRDVGVIDYAVGYANAHPLPLRVPIPAPGRAVPAADEAAYMPASPISYADLIATRWKPTQ